MTDTLTTSDPRDLLSQDDVLVAWNNARALLAEVKQQELEWRKYVVKRAFPQATEGTNTTELGNGYQLKANVRYNYRLLDTDTVEKCLARIAKIGNQGSFIADRLVSWTPNFLLTEYRALSEADTQEAKDILRIVHEMLEITDAAPTVSIVEPKASKKAK